MPMNTPYTLIELVDNKLLRNRHQAACKGVSFYYDSKDLCEIALPLCIGFSLPCSEMPTPH